MSVLATRPRRIALAIAAITAATLGTVSASAAQSTETPPAGGHQAHHSTKPVPRGGEKGHKARGEGGAGIAISYRPTANAPGDVNAVNDDFAACMRAHGEPTVPVFHATKDADGKVTLRVQGGAAAHGATPTPKKFQKALKSCAPILKEVGITISTDVDQLPPLPEPGTPGAGAPGLDSKKSDDGTPSLSSHA
ncbi:hypothetical protein ABZ848_33930 [Streptomyces sp. NPDC047081]|uniref:hypothetical protein n=1 Tax=Streptomyces sp. NPDC047081 TaxID=3154706 RepID=UPI0033E065BA